MSKARPDLKRKMEKISAAHNCVEFVAHTFGAAHGVRHV
jgi:hypothetical protein